MYTTYVNSTYVTHNLSKKKGCRDIRHLSCNYRDGVFSTPSIWFDNYPGIDMTQCDYGKPRV